MNVVWTWPLASTPKLVAIALADIADDDGYCWPSVRHLTCKINGQDSDASGGVSERTVQRAIRALESLGLLEIETQVRRDGSQSSNRYRLKITGGYRGGEGVTNCQGGVTPMTSPPMTPVTGVGDTAMSPLEPPTTHHSRTTTTNSIDLIPPRRLREADAQAALTFVRERLGSSELALKVLDELDGKIAQQRIRGDWQSYLHGLVKRAQDGEFVPAAGRQVAKRRQPVVQEWKQQLAIRKSDPIRAQQHYADIKRILK